MKKSILITFILLLIINANINAQTWQYKLENGGGFARDLAIAAVDNEYLYHRTNSFFKFDQTGRVVSVFPSIASSFSSATKIEGSSTGYVVSTAPAQLEKIDFNGNTLWEFNAPSSLTTTQAVQKRLPTFLSENGNYYFTATEDLYILNEIDGTVINQYSFGGSYACATIVKDNNNFAVLGENLSGGYEIIQMDNSGNVLSKANVNMTAFDMVVTADGYIVVGTENNNITIKLIERNGTEFFSQTFGNGTLHSIIQKEADFVAAGSDGVNGKLLKFDTGGSIVWNETYVDIVAANTRTRVINDTKNEGFVLATKSHILKTDSKGKVNTTEKDLYINGSAILDVNNIAAMINADGSLFWDYSDAYFKTKDTDVNSIFAGNFWIGGYDDALNLKVAGETYKTNGSDYQAGFIGSDAENMNKVWKVSKAEIKRLRGDFDENGTIDGIIPNDILTYPARNNPNAAGFKGQIIPIGTNNFVEFFDRNNDGTYNAFDGDYPIIKGDMQLVWFQNDDKTHTASSGDPLGISMVCKLYGYECGGNDLINNTVFQSYQIQNQGSVALDSVYGGMWIDSDLGCPIDDYFGSIPNKNSYYFYNQDAVDGLPDGSCVGVNTYTGTVPVQSVTYLNKSLDYFTYYFRSDLAPTPGMADPQIATEYYNYLTGTWRDGTSLNSGGDGYNGTMPTNHVYSGNPAISNSWALSNTGATGVDIRTVSSSNFSRVEVGQVIDFEIAYGLHRNLPSHTPNTTDLGNNIDNVQSLYDTDGLNWDIYLGADKDLTVGQNLTLIPSIEGTAGGSNYTYLWSTGATTSTINATAPITYSVTVTDAQGCTKTDEVKVKFATTTENITREIDKINIFPNPATDIITIDATNLENQNLTISIIDITGKIIKNQHFENQDLIQMEVSNISAGVYFLKFSTAQFKEIGFKKIVVID